MNVHNKSAKHKLRINQESESSNTLLLYAVAANIQQYVL